VSRRAREASVPVDLVERWLSHSGVPAFVSGYSRPGAVARRWPWVLIVAVLVAGGVLVAAIVAGYGAAFREPWLAAVLVVGSLIVGGLAAVVGLPEITLFTVRWFLRAAWRSGAGMLRILPILLVALVFTFLSAETWQSIGTLTGTPLVLAAVLLLALTLVPLLRSTDDDHTEFADADEIRAALPAELAGAFSAFGQAGGGGAGPVGPSEGGAAGGLLVPPLALAERINLRLIGALGRAVVAVVVGLSVALFFCVFGVLVVSDAVTHTWVGASPDVWWQFTVGTHRYTLTAEHVRVSLFLGAFSALYLVVSASTDRQLATALSADAQSHVRQCLAVRAVYRTSGTRGLRRATTRRPTARRVARQRGPRRG